MSTLRDIELEKLAKLRAHLVQEQKEMRATGREKTTIYKALTEWIEQIDNVRAAMKKIDE